MAQLVEYLRQNLKAVGLSPTWNRFFHMFVPTWAYAVGAELSYLGFVWEGTSCGVQSTYTSIDTQQAA